MKNCAQCLVCVTCTIESLSNTKAPRLSPAGLTGWGRGVRVCDTTAHFRGTLPLPVPSAQPVSPGNSFHQRLVGKRGSGPSSLALLRAQHFQAVPKRTHRSNLLTPFMKVDIEGGLPDSLHSNLEAMKNQCHRAQLRLKPDGKQKELITGQ